MMENNMKAQRMDLCKTGNAANSLMIQQMKAVLQALYAASAYFSFILSFYEQKRAKLVTHFKE